MKGIATHLKIEYNESLLSQASQYKSVKPASSIDKKMSYEVEDNSENRLKHHFDDVT